MQYKTHQSKTRQDRARQDKSRQYRIKPAPITRTRTRTIPIQGKTITKQDDTTPDKTRQHNKTRRQCKTITKQ